MSTPVLLTGGTGFVGSAVARHLLAGGKFRPRAIVRGAAPAIAQGVEIVRGEFASGDFMEALRGMEVVVHCAARAHVGQPGPDAAAEFERVNVEGTLHLARQSAAAGVRRFVFISSVKVLGDSSPPGRPLRPDSPPAPSDAYAKSKHQAECGLLELARASGMELVIVRPPLVYGPGVKGNFAALVNWVRRGRPVPFGAVSNSRSLVALDNLVNFVALCADRNSSAAAANETFLVSDGEDESTPDLVRKVARAYGSAPPMLAVPPALLWWGANLTGKQAAAERVLGTLQVDSSKCARLLGWKPVVTIDEQLQKMAAGDAGA